MPLVGFIGDWFLPIGTIGLRVITDMKECQTTQVIDFLVVDCPSTYNEILERPTLIRLKAITSMYHLLIRFPMEKGIGEVKGNQVASRECYMASLKRKPSISKENMLIEGLEVWDERSRATTEPEEELEDIILDTNALDRTTQVGADLPKEFKARLRDFLIKNQDVFAWTHEDLLGIDP